ncbi:MAG: hypothetical protein NVSMB2_16760 [Chloroflexota bacterium]
MALDQVLHPDENRSVTGLTQDLCHVALAAIESPPERSVRESHHAGAMRIATGVQRCAAWAALRGRAEATLESDPLIGQTIERR